MCLITPYTIKVSQVLAANLAPGQLPKAKILEPGDGGGKMPVKRNVGCMILGPKAKD
jgi:hypothetical protein